MANAPKAKRYAQALFELATEQGKEQAWLSDLEGAAALLAGPDISLYLGSPRIPSEQKLGSARELLAGKAPEVVNLFGLLLTRRTLSLFDQIVQEYQVLLDERLGRVHAEVTTAVALNRRQQERLEQALGQALGKDVVLDVQEDMSIIGGLRVRIGDQIIDGTVRSRLDSLRHRLSQESLN